MTITATQTRAEFARNTLRIFFHRGMGRFLLLLSFAMLAFYVFQWVMVLFGWAPPKIYLAVAAIGFLTLLPALIYRKATMVYAQNPTVNQPVTYTFTAKDIRMQGQDLDARVRWNQLFLVTEVKDALVLYHTPSIAQPIPKRNFTAAELETLWGWIRKENS